ncbi:MAG: DNA adenine methylase [candidate division WOR-3 bacterium]
MERNGIPRPFLKWAGGKSQILPELLSRVPSDFGAYHEPFLGGGALFFALMRRGILRDKKVFLSDSNPELINAFLVIRDNPEELLELLRGYQRRNTREEYYRIRAENPISPTERAARLIYLNRTCYNGLYRVNSRGEFNVPYGRYKNPRIYDPDNIRAVSEALKGVEVLCEDFEAVLSRAEPGDFVYLDPPYYPLSRTASFSDYTLDGFSEEDHIRLARTFAELAKRGVLVMESNSDTDFVRSYYRGWRLTQIKAKRPINSKGEGRGPVSELVVLSY